LPHARVAMFDGSQKASEMTGGSMRAPLAWRQTQPSSPKALALAVASGDGLPKVRYSPHSSTRMPAADYRTSMPYKSHLPIDLWVRPTRYRNIWDPVAHDMVTGCVIAPARILERGRR
jgi:hypothetical protein